MLYNNKSNVLKIAVILNIILVGVIYYTKKKKNMTDVVKSTVVNSEEFKGLIDKKQEIIERLKIAGLNMIKEYLEKNTKTTNDLDDTSMSLEI